MLRVRRVVAIYLKEMLSSADGVRRLHPRTPCHAQATNAKPTIMRLVGGVDAIGTHRNVAAEL